MGKRKKIFITGAAGAIGEALRKHLRDRYDFRLLFHSNVPEVEKGDEVVTSDVANFEAMLEATAGVDAIVHLALAKWRGSTQATRAQSTLQVDIPGVYNIYEAARLNRVPVVVFASTNHVTGHYEKEGLQSQPDLPVRPDSIYGAGKAFGEALGRLYAERHGIRVLCLRIANFNGEDDPGRLYEPGLSRWLSPRDMAQLTWRCIETEQAPFGIFYGVSRGGEKKFDLSNAKALLGYEPEDDGSLEVYRNKYKKAGG
ncbi:MAG: NAD(P)-dependent oxidoreductase [Candidatus Latescibacteria bacterium]|nr:NAD(P)-dependent oxidoreductase [Candidatus Latescibacterota bacterium]